MTYPANELQDLVEREKIHYKYMTLRKFFTNLANHHHLTLQILSKISEHDTDSFKTCSNTLCKEYVKALEITEV